MIKHIRSLLACGGLILASVGVVASTMPSGPTFWDARARILVGQLEQAIELAKSDASSMTEEQISLLMAEVYGEIGQWERALQMLDSMESGAMLSQVREKRLEIYAQAGNVFDLQKAMTAAFGTDQAEMKYLALASMKKSGNGKYLKTLKQKASDRSNVLARSNLAWVYYQMGAYAEAIKLLKGGAKPSVNLQTAQDRLLLSVSYHRIHQKEKACEALDLDSASKLASPNDQAVVQSLGEVMSCTVRQQSAQSATAVHGSNAEKAQQASVSPDATESLTMKPHGAFKSDETRVPYVDRFNGQGNRNLPIPEGMGITGASGVLLGRGNYVLTNRHVVEEGKHFAIKNALGNVSKARLVKVSAEDDLALLELEQAFPAQQAIAVEEIAMAKAGGQIYSMGYPLWYLLGTGTPSITNGLVSKNSGMNDDPKMFQITAKINKGNSGGPVFDRFGNLIGLTTGKLDTQALRQSEGVDPEGVNFIYQSKELMDFVGRYLDRGRRASTSQRSLSPEEVYEMRLGATVMVAVGR